MIQIDMDMPKSCEDCPCGNAQDGWCYVHNEVLERMENGYPSTETRPDWCPMKEVKHGKWISAKHDNVTKCSECNEEVCFVKKRFFKYCPNCGAYMRESEWIKIHS